MIAGELFRSCVFRTDISGDALRNKERGGRRKHRQKRRFLEELKRSFDSFFFRTSKTYHTSIFSFFFQKQDGTKEVHPAKTGEKIKKENFLLSSSFIRITPIIRKSKGENTKGDSSGLLKPPEYSLFFKEIGIACLLT